MASKKEIRRLSERSTLDPKANAQRASSMDLSLQINAPRILP